MRDVPKPILPALLTLGLLLFVLSAFRRQPETSQAPVEGLGWGVATEVARRLNGVGQVLVLVDEMDPYMKTVMDQVSAVLRNHSGMTLLPVQSLGGTFVDWDEVDPLPKKVFSDVIARYPEADLVLSFTGVPNLSAAERERLGAPRLRFIAAYEQDAEALPALARETLHWMDAVILGRYTRRSIQEYHPGTPSEWFDWKYLVMDPSANERNYFF